MPHTLPTSAALREDGGRVDFRFGEVSRTLDAGLAVGAPWSGGEAIDVAVGLGFEDGCYAPHEAPLELDESGPLFAPDGSGAPAPWLPAQGR